jgi:hypothetical protein
MQEAYEKELKKGMNALAQEIAPSDKMLNNIVREVRHRKVRGFNSISRVAAAACFALILFTAVSFTPPVNALVDRMMYLIVREGSKYNTVEAPYDESKFETYTAVNSSDAQKVLGKSLKLPAQIKIGDAAFKSGEYIVCTNDSTGEKFVALEYLSSDIKTETQLNDTLNSILLEIGKSKQLIAAGDNVKEIKQGNMTLYWAENPYTGRQQITDKPAEIKVYHSLSWQQDGLYYRLIPGEGFDVSIEAALEAKNSIK